MAAPLPPLPAVDVCGTLVDQTWVPEKRLEALPGASGSLGRDRTVPARMRVILGEVKVTGRKRHILVDTLGLLLGVTVLPANIQDRDGTSDLLRGVRRRFPFIEKIFADAGYQGPKMAKTIATTGNWRIEIVKRSDLHHFVVLPKRWIVERTFAWIIDIAALRVSRLEPLPRAFRHRRRAEE